MDNDPYLGFNPSCNNTFAIQVFSNFQRALSVYSCKEYSRIWTCDNCTEAYKRWLCSALYRRCKQNDTEISGGQCDLNFTRTNSKALPDCIMRTCSEVCYEVVRKCPVHLAFRCPPLTDIREYNVTNCNNMERPEPTASGSRFGVSSLHVSGRPACIRVCLHSCLRRVRSDKKPWESDALLSCFAALGLGHVKHDDKQSAEHRPALIAGLVIYGKLVE